MKKKIEYRLVTGKNDANFCDRITALLGEGWQLYGSPSSAFNGTDVIAAQALTREEEGNAH